MHAYRPSLPWVSLLSLTQIVSAQTIVIGNSTIGRFYCLGFIFPFRLPNDMLSFIDANFSTVAAAAMTVNQSTYSTAETQQLTDAVIANLTSLSLTNVSLFDFGDSVSATTKRAAAAASQCKSFPGDASWPTDTIWDVFDILTGGALIQTVPLASSCYDNWDNYDAAECAYITDQWTNSSLQ